MPQARQIPQAKNSSMGGRVGRPRVLAFSAGWSRMKRCGRPAFRHNSSSPHQDIRLRRSSRCEVFSRSKLLFGGPAPGLERRRRQDQPRPKFAQSRLRRRRRDVRAEGARSLGAKSGFSQPRTMIAFSPIPTPNASASRSTGTRSWRRRTKRICSRPGASFRIPIAAFLASPAARPKRSRKPTDSSGAPATPSSSSSSARSASTIKPTAIRPAVSGMRPSAPRPMARAISGRAHAI